MSVEIRGFEGEIDRLAERLDAVDGEATVCVAELFPGGFMETHTDFESIHQFFDASPWTIDAGRDVTSLPAAELDAYVSDHTGFKTWDAMLAAAGREWVTRQLAEEHPSS